MKRFGFTLAEVLITLGIIGVISALTLPSLLNDTTAAQVGPKLGKAASMFEQAAQAMLNEQNVDAISESEVNLRAGDTNSTAAFMEALSNHLRITRYRGSNYSIGNENALNGLIALSIPGRGRAYLSKDGALYQLASPGGFALNTNLPPHKRIIGQLFIDINGAASPNLAGTDVFGFTVMDDGSLVPFGSYAWRGNDNDPQWRNVCANDSVPTTGNYLLCTASIFENNMKVMYKMR